MKTVGQIAVISCSLLMLAGCADHEYQQYQGQQQNWPTAPGPGCWSRKSSND